MRIREIDVSRGILILMIIFVHSYIPYSLAVYFSYILASFMFISGYLFKDGKFSKKFEKILLNLLIPFVFLSLVGYIIYYILNIFIGYSNSVFSNFLDFVIFGYSTFDVPVNVLPLWYLYMFAVAELIFILFIKLRTIHFIPILSILSTLLINEQTKFFKINVALHGLIWFYLGYILKNRGFKFKFKNPFLLFIIFSCLLAVVATFNGFDDWRINSYGNYPLLSYVGEFSSVIIIISLAQMIKTDKIKRFFELFGKNTIFLLGYHIVLPGTLAIFIKDPVQFLEKYWFIYYILAVFILYLFLKIVPENLIYLLEGRFYLLKNSSSIAENKYFKKQNG